jgi:arginine repressor
VLDTKDVQRLSPDQLTVMKLFEIADRLSELQALLAKRAPEGVIYPITFTASTTARKITLIFSATIQNDGAADIYILETDRNLNPDDVPLKSGETLSIDHKERGQYEHWIRTSSGTATVRIFALR